MGLINLGVQLGTTGVVAYIVDCHREQAGEAFATMNVSLPILLRRWGSRTIGPPLLSRCTIVPGASSKADIPMPCTILIGDHSLSRICSPSV